MNWMRVGAAALLTGACTLLVACGSGSVVSDLDWSKGRIITLGDDFTDVGQNGYVFSVNDGSRNWVQQLAHHYGVKVKAKVDGGWAYAQGSARLDSPDPDNGAPSVKEQVDQLLADTKLKKDDLIFINGGIHDIVDAVEKHDSATDQATVDDVEAAAKALVAQVKRLKKAGARHIAVTGVWDIGTSPWAKPWDRTEPKGDGPVTDLTLVFNNRVLVDLVDEGSTVLYLDAAQFYRFIYDDDKRDSYGIKDADKLACQSTPLKDCTKDKALPKYNEYLFADDLHFTPRVWNYFGADDFGSNAYDTVSDRWGRP